jgi:DNA-directed RNA polymerase specialized sigma24 family protein
MTAATIEVPFGQPKAKQLARSEQEQLDQLTNWFSRSLKALHFIASLILGGSEMAERAVENCSIRASGNLPNFENEGAFRSWLMRQLISEALSILHQSHTTVHEENVPEFRKK